MVNWSIWNTFGRTEWTFHVNTFPPNAWFCYDQALGASSEVQ